MARAKHWRRRRVTPHDMTMPPLLLLLALSLSLLSPHTLGNLPVAMAAAHALDYAPIDSHDGPANLREGRRLFQRGDHAAAAAYLWRAVMLQPKENAYPAEEAFTPFLQCYALQDRLTDGFVFVAAEGYLRGQDELGEIYLEQALTTDAGHAGALEVRRSVKAAKEEGQTAGRAFQRLLTDIRDRYELSNPSSQPDNAQTSSNTKDLSPEALYDVATQHFNTRKFQRAEQLYELSCQKSGGKLSVSCTTAVYIRTTMCDWGHLGAGFERDMQIVEEVTRAEARMYRSVFREVNAAARRQTGLSCNRNDWGDGSKGGGVVNWRRGASVHPHMCLGYPLDGTLKRYAVEAAAGLDEARARLADDGAVADLPADLPYDVRALRARGREARRRDRAAGRVAPLRVGFLASGFNSKAVLYLSHDMFRHFDPAQVEVHVFSTGAPDDPRFIRGTMRGVDWRQRVADAVGHFHDVRRYRADHVGLARFVRAQDIHVLIEWDGYARQGDRAAGLMALRPAPLQVLHQEFLMTSGAQYVDYIVTDKVTSPARSEGLYTEKFLYLPNHFFSKGHAVQEEVVPPRREYVPKAKEAKFALGVGSPQENACLSSNPLGKSNGGRDDAPQVSFVYCNFNKFLKNNPETMRSWIRILQEVDDSILCLLKNPPEGVPNLRQFVDQVAAADENAINVNERIHFIDWEKNPFDHQQRSHSLCNAMLDSHPYNGHTTAQDALYAGVPIVTRSDGDDMSSRVTTSANVVLGLEELNAPGGTAEYEDIAIRLGTNRTWFRSVRTRLIDTCLQKDPMHPYWDVARYVSNFQRGLRLIWDRFLDGKEIDHVEVIDGGGNGEEGGTMEPEVIDGEKERQEMKGEATHKPDEL